LNVRSISNPYTSGLTWHKTTTLLYLQEGLLCLEEVVQVGTIDKKEIMKEGETSIASSSLCVFVLLH